MKKAIAVVFMLAVTHAALAQVSSRLSPAGEPPPDVRSGRARLIGRYNNPAQMRRLAFGLATPYPAEEEQFLQELMTPGSPQFHKFLTAEQWIARFSPSLEDEQAVVDWATSQGLSITHRFPNRLIVDVEAPMATIERALQVRINSYQMGADTYIANDRPPVLPGRLANLIRNVEGLSNFTLMHPSGSHEPMRPGAIYNPGPVAGTPRNQHGDADAASSERVRAESHLGAPTPKLTGGKYDPTDIYAANAYDYNALQNQGHCCNPNHLAGGAPPQASIAIAAYGNLRFTGSFPNATFTDIVGFQAQYPYLAFNITATTVDGGPQFCTITPSQPCNNDLETTLDTEWTMATANSFGSFLDTAQVWVYEGEGSYPGNVYNQILSDAHARVLTSSFSCGNPTGESNCPGGVVSSLHSIFNSMVGQGWTMMTASGDAGATADCSTTSVEYPASDPDIVGVGGTTLFSNGSGNPFGSEVAWTGGQGANSCANNNGGSTGGCSTLFSRPSYQDGGANGTCAGQRGVPDISLNANFGQNMFFNGRLFGIGGTSIASPMVAGFFAQEGAYLIYLDNVTGNNCGSFHLNCFQIGSGMGNGNFYLYKFGKEPFYAPHYPFYDITSGCNSNDITTGPPSRTFFCAGIGYDLVTGWGTANMLQLAWAMNTFLAGDFGPPAVTFSGPAIGHWNRTPQNVSWTIADTSANGAVPNGVAGFTQAWDADPGDVYLGNRNSVNNSYFTGPQFPNATTGFLTLNNTLEGCHTAHVRSWDNGGTSSDSTYGGVCFDDIPPSISCGSPDGLWHAANISIACTASDGLSGLANPADASFSLVTSVPAGTETAVAATNSRVVADVAGNTRTAGPIAPNKIDRKAPAVLCGLPDGLWHANNITIPCTAADGGSGLANPADASFGLVTSVPAGTETAVAATNSYAVFDAVGNFTIAGPISPNMIDRKPPVITIVAPAVALYSHGTSLILNYTVTDGGSGVNTVTATMNGSPTVGGVSLLSGNTISFLTLPLGTNTFTVNATDNVGNASTSSVTFTIIATFQDTLNDIDSLLAIFLIDNSTTANMLKAEIMAAQAASGFDRINLLNQFLSDLATLAGKDIFGKAVQILTDDANSLWSYQTPAIRPIANAGPNQTVAKGSTVQLDGSQSVNPSFTIPVSYAWSFTSRPAGSVAALVNPNTVNPTFVADKAGTYVVTLMYSNPTNVSFASVTITAN